ncbi:MAG TPA: hypothetical protein DCS67_12330 [Clostridiales bacterium UBA8960]|nr:hypothetical protein [Clostridiales bacterium UBA8960]
MINRTTKISLNKGVNLHMLHSEKFKTVLIGLYIKRPLNRAEVSLNALLSRVIDKATANIPTSRELNQAFETLYGSLIVSDVHKYGEKQMIQLKIQVPGEKYIGTTNLYKQILELLNDMINHPRVVDGGFDPEVVAREKEGLISEIELRKDHKDSWAMSCCLETMCKDELYRIHEFGSVEDVSKITPVDLYEHLKAIIMSSEIDICIIGDFDEDEMIHVVQQTLTFERGDITPLIREKIYFEPVAVTYFDEPHELTQGKMCLGYRVNVPYESPLYTAVLVASVILGGGGSSRFFKVIREREGLCYTIYSRLEKFKSIMLVYAGVDFENFDKTEQLVEAQIQEVRSGNISDEELDIAKKTVISNIRSISDYPNSYINYYYNLLVSERDIDDEGYIERIKAVTKEDIVEALKNMKLDTVARLIKEENHDESH